MFARPAETELSRTPRKPYERPDEQALIPPPLTKHEREVAEPLAVKLISSPAAEISYALGLRETAPPKPLS